MYLNLLGGSFNLQVLINGIGYVFGSAAANGVKNTVDGEKLHLSGVWRV